MKIKKISVHQVNLEMVGRYEWRRDEIITHLDSTFVAIETDEGITGWGETCPFGPAFVPAFAAGARAGIAELVPHLIGQDPRQPDRINVVMDTNLAGHPYVKSAVDMACWDIFGQAVGLPVCELLGGRFGDGVPLTRSIERDTPERMAEQAAKLRDRGVRQFRFKAGAGLEDIARIRAVAEVLGPEHTLGVDANGAWTVTEALRVIRAIGDVDIASIEQPCATYDECLRVRRQTDIPIMLDESVQTLPDMLRVIRDDAAHGINIKIGKMGGLTVARKIRDLCVASGLEIFCQDSGGGDITCAAFVHLAHSTPETIGRTASRFGSGSFTVNHVADGGVEIHGNTIRAASAPGLGFQVLSEAMGKPVAVYTDRLP